MTWRSLFHICSVDPCELRLCRQYQYQLDSVMTCQLRAKLLSYIPHLYFVHSHFITYVLKNTGKLVVNTGKIQGIGNLILTRTWQSCSILCTHILDKSTSSALFNFLSLVQLIVTCQNDNTKLMLSLINRAVPEWSGVGPCYK